MPTTEKFLYEYYNYKARMIVSWAIIPTIWICKLCKARSATYQVAVGMAVGVWFVMDFVAWRYLMYLEDTYGPRMGLG